MKITLTTLLEGVEYVAAPGNEYEVAPGVWGTMRPPTATLVDEVHAKTGDGEASDLVLCRMVLSGLKPFDEGDVIMGMPAFVVRDFFTLVEKTAVRLTSLFQLAPQSEVEPEQQ